MRKLFLLVSFVSAGAAFSWAQGFESNRIAYWPIGEMRAIETNEMIPKAKTPGGSGARVGSKMLFNLPTHRIMLAHRASSSPPEVHKAETDVFVVQSGGGVLQVGGEKFKMAVGDVVNIPPNIHHNWFLEPGQTVTYFIVKVEEQHSSPR